MKHEHKELSSGVGAVCTDPSNRHLPMPPGSTICTDIAGIVVTGSRSWSNPTTLCTGLLSAIDIARNGLDADSAPIRVVYGDCPTGADAMVHSIALSTDKRYHRGVEYKRYCANWKLYKLSAGPIRNAEMINTHPVLVLAFPFGKSKGTWGTVVMAMRQRIPVYIPNVNGVLERYAGARA